MNVVMVPGDFREPPRAKLTGELLAIVPRVPPDNSRLGRIPPLAFPESVESLAPFQSILASTVTGEFKYLCSWNVRLIILIIQGSLTGFL